MIRLLPALALLLPLASTASHAQTPALERTDAFERSYATSFYGFDACGDSLAGRLYRKALVERFGQCPFSDQARKTFQQRTLAQRLKSSKAISRMIEQHGGLPMRLDGMTTTCREQQVSAEYVAVREKLERFARGEMSAADLLPETCDAESIAP
jgi:hypothetical protein